MTATCIFKTLGLIRLSRIRNSLIHEPQKWQILKLSCANCVMIKLIHELGCPALQGWLALPGWLLFRYYMNRASPESPFLYRDWMQCAWAECVIRCPVSHLVDILPSPWPHRFFKALLAEPTHQEFQCPPHHPAPQKKHFHTRFFISNTLSFIHVLSIQILSKTGEKQS